MLFTELRFLVLFGLAFTVAWSLRGNGARKVWLLVCSYAFYAAWDWRFLGLLLLSTIVDYVAGFRMARLEAGRPRRPYLWFSLATNLGILGFYKYFDFFVESASELCTALGFPFQTRTLGLVLPLGISFYTFQTLSYTIDVYRGRLQATRSPLDFALFVAFFPQLVAGPIVRAVDLLPQLVEKRRLADVRFRANAILFLLGYVKKACVADHIARAIDPVFLDPGAYTAAGKLLASLLYTLQIYCDFSGYSDMAIATAAFLGYRLTENFAFPYLARSIRDFWRRWHISLSTWFRDYLYIPLGGGRGSRARVGANLVTVFLLCGLWHGANWTFVVWGIWHGAFLMIERAVSVERMPRWLGHVYALAVVNLGFVFFRAPDLATATAFLGGMVGLGGDAGAPLLPVAPAWWLLLAAFAAAHVLASEAALISKAARVPAWIFSPAYGAAVALVLPWAASGFQPFIYFQF